VSSSIEVEEWPQIGAEIRGVDVRTLDAGGFDTIYRAWLATMSSWCRSRSSRSRTSFVTAAASVSSSRTRRIHAPPGASRDHRAGSHKFGADGSFDMAIYRRGAEGWHTDGAYDEEPFKATQLYAVGDAEPGWRHVLRSMYARTRPCRRASGRGSTDGRVPSPTAAAGKRRPSSTRRTETGPRLPSDHRTHPRRAQGTVLRSG